MTSTRARVVLLAALILAISILHYTTGTQSILLHQIYQRLYYIPVVMGAIWFGLRGGVVTSLLSSILYFPHILHQWAGNAVYRWNQYYEIMVIILVGVVTGVLSSSEKRQRSRLEVAMADLSAAYGRLQKAFDELQRRDRMTMLGQLAAGIAHEIRNPLGSIQGAIDIVESGDEAARREFIGIVRKEIDRLNGIVNHFLSFARPRPLDLRPNDVNAVVRSLAQLVGKNAESQNVRIGLECGTLQPALIDSEQLKAALMNIVLNGIHAMPRGGRLEISTSMNGARIRVAVTDEGGGIPVESHERLFEPFFTTRADGTGLGLAIARQTIENHGGTLRMASTGPTGTTFEVEVPGA